MNFQTLIALWISSLCIWGVTLVEGKSHGFRSRSRNNGQSGVCETQECKATAEMFQNALNFSVNPCEDFYEFACGTWKKTNPNPPTSPKWSQFSVLMESLYTNLQDILTSPINDKDLRAVAESKTFYKSCVNLDKIDELGIRPLKDLLDKFGGWPLIEGDKWDKSKFKVEHVIGDLRRTLGENALIDIQVSRDVKNTDRNVILLDQPSLFFPRELFMHPQKFKTRLEAYHDLIENIAQEIYKETRSSGEPSTIPSKYLKEKINDLVSFETKLAHASASEEDRVEVEKTYNPFKVQEFQNYLAKQQHSSNSESVDDGEKNVSWEKLLAKVFEDNKDVTISSDEEIIVNQPKYIQKLHSILEETPLETVANYIQWKLVASMIPESTSDILDIKFNFDKINRGLNQIEKREKSCANFDLGSNYYPLGYAVGSKYIGKYFLPEAKENIENMVHYLRGAFSELLESSDWLDVSTRLNAGEKLKLMSQFIGYPDWLTNSSAIHEYYEGLQFNVDNHFENYLSLVRWNSKKDLKKLRESTKRDEMESHAVYINAQYAPEVNSITFPAGILASPFYRNKGPASVNFGGIGVVIGHEITHGFDNQGSQYDKRGNAVDWWTKDVKEQFKEKAKCMIDQYSGFSTAQGSVNGQLTAGENIADNGGIREAYLGYRNWIKEKNGGEEELRLPGLEDLTPDQLFFLGYANVWCQNVLPQTEQMLLMTDVHSPGRFRVLGGLQNSETFAKAWNCPRDAAMNPKDKCVIW